MGALNWLDIGIIGIMLIFIIAGFAKGFLQSLLKLFGSVASLAIGIWLAKPVAVFINGIFDLTGWFATKFAAEVTKIVPVFGEVLGADLSGAALKSQIEALDLNGILEYALNILIKDDILIEAGSSVSTWIGNMLGAVATLVVSAILIYLAIRIAIGILSKVFDAITKNPAIGGLDRLLGLVFGAAKGALLIAVLFAVYPAVAVVPGVQNIVSPLIDSSVIAKPIYTFVSEFVATYLNQIDFSSLFASVLG